MEHSKRKKFYHWLTYKYQLIIRNEENFEEKTTIRFNYVKVLFIFFIAFVSLFLISFFIGKTVLNRWYDPEYATHQQKKQIIELSLKLDSLNYVMNLQDVQLVNMRAVLSGEDTLDSYSTGDSSVGAANSNVLLNDIEIQPVEAQIRKMYENGDLMNPNSVQFSGTLKEKFFLPPINAYHIAQKFDRKSEHYGVDLVSKKDEPVKVIDEGTVIVSNWTRETGYTILVQHDDDFISVYKHNSVLLKKVGNFVQTGDILGVIGNSGELTSGPHLHFELWYKGNPVNPEEYLKLTK